MDSNTIFTQVSFYSWLLLWFLFLFPEVMENPDQASDGWSLEFQNYSCFIFLQTLSSDYDLNSTLKCENSACCLYLLNNLSKIWLSLGRGQQTISSNPTQCTESRSGGLSGCVIASPQHMLTVRWKQQRPQLKIPTTHHYHCHHHFLAYRFWNVLFKTSFLGHLFSQQQLIKFVVSKH